MSDEEVGELIRRARARANMSVRKLAAATELDAAYLSRLENGKKRASVEVLQRLAAELGDTDLDMYVSRHVRTYFRQTFGVKADEAEILAGLIEDFQAKRKEQEDPRDKDPHQGGDDQTNH